MQIRILREDDADAYQELRLRALQTDPEAFESTYEREAKFSRETVLQRIRPTPDKFILGSFRDGNTLVGIVTFVRESGVKTAHKAHVYSMYVEPDVRGHGVGKSLLLELIERAHTCDGLEQLNLTVVSENTAAKRLYTSVGFEVYGVERNAVKSGGQYQDEDLMVLKLPSVGTIS